MFSAPFLVTLLDRVKAIVRRVARPVAMPARMVSGMAATTVAPMPPVLHGPAEDWMAAKARALATLMRRIRAGEKLEPSLTVPHKAVLGRDPAALARARVAPQERLPRGFGWMCASGPKVREHGRMFAEWLSEPGTRALVLTAPERMARVIEPILNATGERGPEWLPKRETRSFTLSTGLSRSPVQTSEAVDVAGDVRAKPGHDDEESERLSQMVSPSPPRAGPTLRHSVRRSPPANIPRIGFHPFLRQTSERRCDLALMSAYGSRRHNLKNRTTPQRLAHDYFVTIP
jgi:hypothetical protein